jgi:hypothetical protein
MVRQRIMGTGLLSMRENALDDGLMALAQS